MSGPKLSLSEKRAFMVAEVDQQEAKLMDAMLAIPERTYDAIEQLIDKLEAGGRVQQHVARLAEYALSVVILKAMDDVKGSKS